MSFSEKGVSMNFNPKEVIATGLGWGISEILSYQGVSPEAAASVGKIAESAVKRFEFKQKTTGSERLSSALQAAMSEALSSPNFELSTEAREVLLDALSPERAMSYSSSDSAAEQLTALMHSVLTRFNECNLDSLPIESISSDALELFEQAIQNNYDMTGLASYLILQDVQFDQKKILKEITALKQMYNIAQNAITTDNPWIPLSFDNQVGLEHAILGYNLRPSSVNSCPRLPQIKIAKDKLDVAHYVFINGKPGCGKSITAYQLAYDYHKDGWTVYTPSTLLGNDVHLDVNVGKAVFIVDNAQSISYELVNRLISC